MALSFSSGTNDIYFLALAINLSVHLIVYG